MWLITAAFKGKKETAMYLKKLINQEVLLKFEDNIALK